MRGGRRFNQGRQAFGPKTDKVNTRHEGWIGRKKRIEDSSYFLRIGGKKTLFGAKQRASIVEKDGLEGVHPRRNRSPSFLKR